MINSHDFPVTSNTWITCIFYYSCVFSHSLAQKKVSILYCTKCSFESLKEFSIREYIIPPNYCAYNIHHWSPSMAHLTASSPILFIPSVHLANISNEITICDGSNLWAGFPFCSQTKNNSEDDCDCCQTSQTWGISHSGGLDVLHIQTVWLCEGRRRLVEKYTLHRKPMLLPRPGSLLTSYNGQY